MKQPYEIKYQTEDVLLDEITPDYLENRWGQYGWELVSLIKTGLTDNHYRLILKKKEKINP